MTDVTPFENNTGVVIVGNSFNEFDPLIETTNYEDTERLSADLKWTLSFVKNKIMNFQTINQSNLNKRNGAKREKMIDYICLAEFDIDKGSSVRI